MVATMAMPLLGRRNGRLPRSNGRIGFGGLGMGRCADGRDDSSERHSEREYENERVA